MRLLASLLFAGTLCGADLAGIWVGQMEVRNGEFVDVAFKFTQTGGTLGGKLYGDYRSGPISDAVVAGDLITFVVTAPEQAGNQINEARLRFTGRLVNGELELVRDREGATSAGTKAGAPVRVQTKQALRLKRLL
ncbi:MAG: hypothetical protein IPM24_26020 [Bryobacterales bacterium]|jgi:hypothetical protein|nr:hypothetical protein [Bryobacterales bacterium]